MQGRLSNGTSLPSLPPVAVPSSAAEMARDAAAPAAAAVAPPNALPLGNALTDYDDLLAGPVATLVDQGKAVGGEVWWLKR